MARMLMMWRFINLWLAAHLMATLFNEGSKSKAAQVACHGLGETISIVVGLDETVEALYTALEKAAGELRALRW
jgi:hypothetical protein